MSEMDQKLKTILGETFSIGEDQIEEGTSVETVEAWDSINHLTLVMNLEDSTGLRFSPEEIRKLISYKAIKEIIEAKS